MKELERVIKYLQESMCDQKQGSGYQEIHNEILNIAIQALQKQLPKIPLNQKYVNKELMGICPSCRLQWDVAFYQRYCSNCGQKLDWS